MSDRGMAYRALLLVPLTAALGCSNQVVVGSGGTSSSGHTAASVTATTGASVGVTTSSATTSSGTGGTQPPPPPNGAPPGDGSAPVVIAVSKIFIGTTDRMGNASSSAWKGYGFNIDNQITTPTSDLSMHCKPNSNASPAQMFPDAPGGIDNSWGKNLLPIFKNAAGSTDLQAGQNQAIANGTWTIVFDMPALGPNMSYDPVKSFALLGEMKNGTTWEMDPSSVAGSTPDTANAQFPSSYLAQNTWVSGGDGTIVVRVPIGGIDMRLTIHHAVIAMNLSADHQVATNGTIAGVLDTEEFAMEVQRIVGAFDVSLCSGPATQSILTQVRQASDILSDGTQDPTKTCNGISIGLGFEGQAANIGGLGPPVMYPDPCTTGG